MKTKSRFLLTAFLAVLATGAFLNRAAADVSASVSIWHGYDFYYPNLGLSAANPAPVTYHQMESPSGALWQQFGSTNGGNPFFLTNDLNAVIHEFTNGLWKLYLNKGHVSEEIYYFAMSMTGVTTNELGNVSIWFPLDGSNDVTNQPTFHWTGPSNLATVYLWAYHQTSGNSYFAALPGTATNWTPEGPLTPGRNTLLVEYYTNNFPGITFTTPTNSSGVPLANWSAKGDLYTYLFSNFTVLAPSGGGGNASLFGHYTFDDEFALTADSSGLGHDAAGVFYTGAGTQFPQYAPAGIAGGAVEFDGFNAIRWETSMVNVLSGSYSISLWLETTQSYGTDTDDGRDGAAIFTGDGFSDFPVPMALTGNKLAFYTAVPEHTIHSTTDVNSGAFTHLVVTRDATTGRKSIYVDGVLSAASMGGTSLTIGSTEVYLGYGYYSGQGIVGTVDDLQVYTGVLSDSQIQSLYSSPGSTAPPPVGVSSGHTNIAHYRFDDGGDIGHDDSGRGNHFVSGSTWGSSEHNYEADGAAGSGAVRFYGVSSMVHIPPSESFTNITAATANSFSLSVWVKTSATTGSDTDDAYYGAVVIWSYHSGTDDIIPVSITGNKVAFHTGDEFGSSQTLHSTSDVTDGNYHHIVVTRNRDTGEKNIYVDGVLEATQTGTTRILNANDYYFSLGGVVAHSFDGLTDDLQVYSGVLSASEVASLYNNPGSTAPDVSGGDLMAHYDFDEGTVLAADVSGNGNPIVHAGNFGGGGPEISLDTKAGAGSVSFDGGSYLTASSNLLGTIARTFSISVWVKTSQSVGSPGDMAYWGAAIVSADLFTGSAGDAVPIALTAGQVAFNTGDGFSDETLNSSATVNDDLWHHLVVTRNQATGEKQIYIDGALDCSAVGTTVLLDGPQLLTLGAKSDASDPDPASPDSNGSQGYAGLLDDIRIYNRVLGSNEVAFLHSNPGSGLAGTSATNFNAALNTTNLVWTTSGATNWFTQTSVTHDGGAAARSGAIGDGETTTLQTVFYGTNTITFWWKADTQPDADYIEFYHNGNFVASLSGDSGWQQYVYDLTDPGQHILEWTYVKDGSGAAGQDAVFLDEVSLATVPPPAPVTFSLSIVREQLSIYNEYDGGKTRFYAFPGLYSPDSPISYHYVESPSGFCSGYDNGSGGSGTTFSFAELVNNLTNGNWKLWLNKATPQEQFFNFTLSTVNFTSNSLGHITITAPLDGATGVSSNTPYQWSGPAGWASLSVNAFQQRPAGTHYYGYANLPTTSTNWPAGPALDGGTNFFVLGYDRNDTANFVTSTPFSTWSLGDVHYQLSATSWFVVSESAVPPPNLRIARTSSNTVAVTWPSPSTGWNLQQNTNTVSSVNWSNVVTTPLDDGTTKTLIVNPPTGNRFYRLFKP